ncbi:MAG: hypothetical protein AAFS10_04915 [Myxococcota bacterium]
MSTPTTPTTQPASSSWWTEGNRKLLMTIAGLAAFAGVAITWLVVQPDNVTFEQLMIWTAPVLTGLTGMGVGGNVLEHRYKKSSSTSTSTMLLLSILLVVCVGGCSTPPRYPAVATASLAASTSVASAAKLEAARAERVVACVTAAALETAFASAGEALSIWMADTPDTWTLPGVEVDLQACEKIAGTNLSLLSTETAGQVRQTVDALAPAALAVTRAILTSSDLGCEDLVLASSVLAYVEGASGPILGWLDAPGSVLLVPSVVVDLSVCR